MILFFSNPLRISHNYLRRHSNNTCGGLGGGSAMYLAIESLQWKLPPAVGPRPASSALPLASARIPCTRPASRLITNGKVAGPMALAIAGVSPANPWPSHGKLRHAMNYKGSRRHRKRLEGLLMGPYSPSVWSSSTPCTSSLPAARSF